ncbi:MAG: hypothetical protein RIS36_1859 [Pseudomonadota bacterium]|jgi:hypothetical protein
MSVAGALYSMVNVSGMEQNKAHQQHQHEQQHDAALRDDLTWTQYITNLAANKLAPPKSQTSKVLEDFLTRLSEELYVKGEERIRERLKGGDGEMGKDLAFQSRNLSKEGKVPDNGLVVSNGDLAGAEPTLARRQVAPELNAATAKMESLSFAGNQEVARPTGPVQQLHHEIIAGNRWIDVLWQFIAAHQKRVVDPDRLGIEPSERMDIQVELIRQMAASYEKLGMLTRLPDSLSEARELKVVDDIRTMALVYVTRSLMDVASPSEIAGDDDDESARKKRRTIEFPRSVVSPYEGISPIDVNPMELLLSV